MVLFAVCHSFIAFLCAILPRGQPAHAFQPRNLVSHVPAARWKDFEVLYHMTFLRSRGSSSAIRFKRENMLRKASLLRRRHGVSTRLDAVPNSFSAVDAWLEAQGKSLLDLGRLGAIGDIAAQGDALRSPAYYSSEDKVDSTEGKSSCIHLHGTSDARLTRGLLIALRAGLRATPAIDLLEGRVSLQDIAALHFVRSLPPQQQLGLRSIWEIILRQIRSQILGFGDLAPPGEGAPPSMNAGLTSQNLRKGDAAFHSSRASALSSVTSGAAIHRVACLLSGGVDSSVALALLCNQEGVDVEAFYLKVWMDEDLHGTAKAPRYLPSSDIDKNNVLTSGIAEEAGSASISDYQCPWEEDVQFADAVCKQLRRSIRCRAVSSNSSSKSSNLDGGGDSVPLHIIPAQRTYFEQVVGPCLTASSAGYTPNPDALCNSRVKFHVLDAAIEEVTRVQAGREPCVPQGEGSRSRYDYIASGHYARRYPAAPPLSTQKRVAVHSDKNAAYRVPDIARKPYLSEAEERAVRTAALDLWGYDYKHDDGSTGSPPVLLLESVDPSKDQTYFLSRLSQTQLQRAAFPIGHLTKAEVRAVATSGIATTQSPPMNMLDTRSGTCTTSNHSSSSHDQEEVAWVSLATARRKDSQGICFLGKIKFDDFLEQRLGCNPGPIVEAGSGAVIGQHRGLWFHTLGQHKGIGPLLTRKSTTAATPTSCSDTTSSSSSCSGTISSSRDRTHRASLSGQRSHMRWWVVGKDVRRNVLFVSNRTQDVILHEGQQLLLEDMNWISGIPKVFSDPNNASVLHNIEVRLMHGPARIPCSLRQVPVGGSSSSSSSSSSSNSNDRIAGSASTAAGKVGVDGEVGVGACIGGLGSGCFELDVQGPARPGAPGQIAVIYRGLVCVGSGVISASTYAYSS